MAAPRVQTLAEAMADLNPAYAASKDVVNKQISGLGAKYDAQRAGINAARGQGFNTINNQATGRGASFSGIPIDEQATYLSTKYLPGMQQADYQQNEEGLQLKGKLSDIDKELRLGAVGRIDKQQSSLDAWNSARAAEAFQAAENAKNLAAQARENELNRQNQLKLQSMQISASRSAAASAQPSANAQIRAYLDQYVNPKTGKVPVAVWQNAVRRAYEGGMTFGGNAGFASTFWNYADNKNWQAYQKGYEKWMK